MQMRSLCLICVNNGWSSTCEQLWATTYQKCGDVKLNFVYCPSSFWPEKFKECNVLYKLVMKLCGRRHFYFIVLGSSCHFYFVWDTWFDEAASSNEVLRLEILLLNHSIRFGNLEGDLQGWNELYARMFLEYEPCTMLNPIRCALFCGLPTEQYSQLKEQVDYLVNVALCGQVGLIRCLRL